MMIARSVQRYGRVLLPLLFLLFLAACATDDAVVSASLPTATRPEAATVETTEVAPATVEPTAQPSPTPEPQVREDAGPTLVIATISPVPCESQQDLDAVFVSDVDLADRARIAPGLPFLKTWRLENTGTCSWPDGTELVYITGDVLPGPQRVPVSAPAPGRQVDVSINFSSPTRPGTYESYWRLQAPGGHLFGAVVFVELTVDGDAGSQSSTMTPTFIASPPPSPTQTPTPEPTTGDVATLEPTLTPSPIPVASPSPTPRPQNTATYTPVPPTATPLPTRTPTPASGPICQEPDPRFVSVISQAIEAGLEPLCISGPTQEEAGLAQIYWLEVGGSEGLRFRSLALLAASSDTVFLLTGKDEHTYLASVDSFEDTWDASMPDNPAACAALPPPEGYVLPTQSIGKVWCEQSLWLSIGWPKAAAQSVTLTLQPAWNGLLIEAKTATGPTYLAAIDADAGLATVQERP